MESLIFSSTSEAHQLNLCRPKHGGDILAFSQRTGFDLHECIDLSTGIAPWSWPVPEIPQEIWQTLPTGAGYEKDLINAAAAYYGCESLSLLPIPGSQAGIELIPQIAKSGAKVAYPLPGFEEHRFAWEKSGVEIFPYEKIGELESLVQSAAIDHAVVINPNNPSTEACGIEKLDALRCALQSRGGFLVVDEAFADPNPSSSCIGLSNKQGLIILRSVGKFFGLAGLRLGFMAAEPDTLEELRTRSGLWAVSTPALWLGAKMLSDQAWAAKQITRCKQSSERMYQLVGHKFDQLEWSKTDLFLSGKGTNTQVLHYQTQLAESGIHSRYIALDQDHALLRLGLANKEGLERIENL